MTTYLNPANAAYIDGLLHEFESNPVKLDPTWRSFFEGMRYVDGESTMGAEDLAFELKVLQLVQAYRTLGHLIADVNPLDRTLKSHPLLELSRFELSESDFDRPVKASALLGFEEETILSDIVAFLRQIYCSTVAVEYGHIDDVVSRQWVQDHVESGVLLTPLAAPLQKRVLHKLAETECLENLLHKRFVGQKRFSGEGNDVMIPMVEHLIRVCAEAGANELVFGTAHRGRLSLLAFVFQKDVKSIFAEFIGNVETETTPGDGDVKYHLGHSGNITTPNGKTVHLSLVPNPSHLETVNPVVMGIVRAKQKLKNDSDRSKIIPVLMHGDASFAGQGIIYETLNMSELPGYTIGGTIHIIINNQIGFTALPRDGRSTPNATDVAKMLQAPIIRVNADEPDAAIRAMELATQYRIAFKRDVFIDLIGYRRYGHNEGDEPAFTQPTMYQKITHHPRVLEQYAARLTAAGVVTGEEIAALQQKIVDELEARLTETRSTKISKRADAFADRWRSLKPIPTGEAFFAPTGTSVAKQHLLDLGRELLSLPKTFHPHPKIVRFLSDRQEMLEEKRGLDWGMGEALAYASLIHEGFSIRLAGQDSERGTFSHRHSVLYDAETGHRYVPLNNLKGTKADYEVLNSLLSEYAAMGFEFGQTLADPNKLVLWEAQFGDFANGGQIVIDQCLVGSAVKWQRYSGLVLLLPHGYEGQGPEHSSARLERYLQACAQHNIQVCHPSLPAQFFHLVRRQMLRPFRLPLVILSPKSGLRHPQAVSSFDDLAKGSFEEVLDDSTVKASADTVILTSGKMFYELLAERTNRGLETPLLRLEQFYPFPEGKLKTILGKYKKLREIRWCQEEPQNMGGWNFVKENISCALSERSESKGRRVDQKIVLKYVGRPPQASTSGGYTHVHEAEQRMIAQSALGAL